MPETVLMARARLQPRRLQPTNTLVRPSVDAYRVQPTSTEGSVFRKQAKRHLLFELP